MIKRFFLLLTVSISMICTTSAYGQANLKDIERAKHWAAQGYDFDASKMTAYRMDQTVKKGSPTSTLTQKANSTSIRTTTMGFANSDGSQDTYDLETGSMTMGFRNSDGSQDTYGTGSD